MSTTTPAPLSGFLASQRFAQARVPRPCFVPRPFLGFSLQSLPLAEIVVPSRGHLLPCGHSPACGASHDRRLVASGFPDARARAQLPGSPGDYGLPFAELTPDSRLPWTTDEGRPFRQLHPLRSFHPPASTFPPTRVAPNRRAAALLGFVPSRVPFQTSDPRTRSADLATLPDRRNSPDAVNNNGSVSRQHPVPFETGPHRLSAALLLPRPWVQRSPAGPDPRSIEVPER